MKTWSWTHDFESYLYWWKWPISGTSIIRDAGKEKNKAIKGESRGGRVTNLILTKLKGYSTQNIKIMRAISSNLQQFDRSVPLRIPKSNDTAEEALRVEQREQWWQRKFHISVNYKKINIPLISEALILLSSIFPSLFGRWVSELVFDGVVVNHNNDSQKRCLYKETHVCSLLFKRPA